MPGPRRAARGRAHNHDPARCDYAQTFTRLIDDRDYEFAIKMLADDATEAP